MSSILNNGMQLTVTTDNTATVNTRNGSTTITIGSTQLDVNGGTLLHGNVVWLRYPKDAKTLTLDDAGGRITVSADGQIIGTKSEGQ